MVLNTVLLMLMYQEWHDDAEDDMLAAPVLMRLHNRPPISTFMNVVVCADLIPLVPWRAFGGKFVLQ